MTKKIPIQYFTGLIACDITDEKTEGYPLIVKTEIEANRTRKEGT